MSQSYPFSSASSIIVSAVITLGANACIIPNSSVEGVSPFSANAAKYAARIFINSSEISPSYSANESGSYFPRMFKNSSKNVSSVAVKEPKPSSSSMLVISDESIPSSNPLADSLSNMERLSLSLVLWLSLKLSLEESKLVLSLALVLSLNESDSSLVAALSESSAESTDTEPSSSEFSSESASVSVDFSSSTFSVLFSEVSELAAESSDAEPSDDDSPLSDASVEPLSVSDDASSTDPSLSSGFWDSSESDVSSTDSSGVGSTLSFPSSVLLSVSSLFSTISFTSLFSWLFPSPPSFVLSEDASLPCVSNALAASSAIDVSTTTSVSFSIPFSSNSAAYTTLALENTSTPPITAPAVTTPFKIALDRFLLFSGFFLLIVLLLSLHNTDAKCPAAGLA